MSRGSCINGVSTFGGIGRTTALICSFRTGHGFRTLLRRFRPSVVRVGGIRHRLALSVLSTPCLGGRHIPIICATRSCVLLYPTCAVISNSNGIYSSYLSNRFFRTIGGAYIGKSGTGDNLTFLRTRFLGGRRSCSGVSGVVTPDRFVGRGLSRNKCTNEAITVRGFLAADRVSVTRGMTGAGGFGAIRPCFLFFNQLSGRGNVLALIETFLQTTNLVGDKITNDGLPTG